MNAILSDKNSTNVIVKLPSLVPAQFRHWQWCQFWKFGHTQVGWPFDFVRVVWPKIFCVNRF